MHSTGGSPCNTLPAGATDEEANAQHICLVVLFQHNKLRTATKPAGLSAAVEEAGGVITLGADEPARVLARLHQCCNK